MRNYILLEKDNKFSIFSVKGDEMKLIVKRDKKEEKLKLFNDDNLFLGNVVFWSNTLIDIINYLEN